MYTSSPNHTNQNYYICIRSALLGTENPNKTERDPLHVYIRCAVARKDTSGCVPTGQWVRVVARLQHKLATHPEKQIIYEMGIKTFNPRFEACIAPST